MEGEYTGEFFLFFPLSTFNFSLSSLFLPLPPRHPSNCLNSQIAVRKFSAPAYVSRVLVS
jgi:hypothetical protein